MRVFAKRCPGWALRIWCGKVPAVCERLESDRVSLIPHDPQVIPELKLQVTELQKQKQELEAHIQEQHRDLAGKYEPFQPSCYVWTGKKLEENNYERFVSCLFYICFGQKKNLNRSQTIFKPGLQKKTRNAGKMLRLDINLEIKTLGGDSLC